MAQERVGGTIYFKINGQQYRAKGNFTYNLGRPKRETVVGADGIHGYLERPQVPYIEGEITDSIDLSFDQLTQLTGATVTIELANGKTIAIRDAQYSADGVGNTEEGNLEVRFEGASGEEVR